MIHLPEDDAEAFAEIVSYKHTGRLSDALDLKSKATGTLESTERFKQLLEVEPSLSLVSETYDLSRKLGMERFPNEIIDVLDSYKMENMTSTAAELDYILRTI